MTADKGWTHLLFHDLRDRLRAFDLRCAYIDGRPAPGEACPDEVGVMQTALKQLRRAVRESVERIVVVLPHLDVMAPSADGWTSISRELVPLLYEQPEVVLLGFRDPTLLLLPIVEKLFPRRYTIERPFREPIFSPPEIADVGPRAAAPATKPEPGAPVDRPRELAFSSLV